MIIKKINEVVCDLNGCSNKTTKQIRFSAQSGVGLNLCDNCLKNLYDLMAREAHGKEVKIKK